VIEKLAGLCAGNLEYVAKASLNAGGRHLRQAAAGDFKKSDY
jgi:hypothetical protein